MTSTTARFVVLEGGDVTGKSTQARRLAARLRDVGHDVVETFEPGATPLGARLRALLLHDEHSVDPVAEALLMAADRAEHVAEVVRPALQRGAWVVSDRFTDSSYAYQGTGRGLDVDFIAELERRVVGIAPAMTLLLDIGVAHGRERTRGRDLAPGGNGPDRIEREQDHFFQRVREGFLARARAEPQRFRVVDATQPVDVVAAQAVACLRELAGI